MSNGRIVLLFKRALGFGLISSVVITQLGCSSNITEVTQGIIETEPQVISESVSEIETEVSISEETTLQTEFDDLFTVETEETFNPLLSSGIDLEHYEGEGGDILGNPGYMGFMFGFDNKYSLDTLRNITYEYTGVYYDNLTLSDVNYFQGFSTRYVTGLSQDKFNFYFADDYFGSYSLCFVRAILIEQGLRFGIDEIPYSYFEQRFPFFLDCMENDWDLPTCMLETDDFGISDISEIGCNYDYDYIIFNAIIAYNLSRATYIYNNPYGSTSDLTDDVLQVRDASTGNNVLVPTEEQYYQMMEDINSIPGCENVDIAVVESRENFYEAYGYYPEDVLNPDMMYEENNMEIYLQNNPDQTRFD